jgi:hypothetical protein
LAAAVTEQQPIGLSGEETKFDSFGVYGFDIMLNDKFKPLVIEANFAPDCTRACQVKRREKLLSCIIYLHFYIIFITVRSRVY